MKIAVPSDDGVTIAGHFGKAEGFLFFDADGKCVKSPYYRRNGSHREQCCQNGGAPGHADLLTSLAECDAIIAGGMGPGMFDNLRSRGVDVFLTRETDAHCAVSLYLHNALELATESLCEHADHQD